MKRIIILTTLALSALISCQKEVATTTGQTSRTVSATPASSSNADIVLKADFTGFQLENLCTGEIMTAISGDAVFNVAPDGNLRNFTIHNFVLKTPDGTVYHNNWIITFEPIGSTGFINTYKMISNPQGDGTHWVLQGQFKVISDVNGVITVQFDKFFIKCL